MSSLPITLSSLAAEERSERTEGKAELPIEPISPHYVIPITPINTSPILIPSYPSDGTASSEPNFDHNDVKYQCCYGYMHITLAARIVSIVYFCSAIFIVFLTVCSQGVTLAFYSIASFAFAFAVFGTLTYGIFKEKQTFILPYIIFQITSVICTVLIIFIFIIGSIFSNKMLNSLAADLGGIFIDDNLSTTPNMQIFGLLFVTALVALLFIQLWFMDRFTIASLQGMIYDIVGNSK
uniref:MARVEL domain-containing protein n=1 Tax=Elaeophora elaphi TaxID=1147741 RepID=A0A0R3RKG3_9BILA